MHNQNARSLLTQTLRIADSAVALTFMLKPNQLNTVSLLCLGELQSELALSVLPQVLSEIFIGIVMWTEPPAVITDIWKDYFGYIRK